MDLSRLNQKGKLVSLLKEKSKDFSPAQRRIAEFILSNYQKVSFMTSLKLAEEVGVSQASVIRFANLLGFEGYPQLREGIQNIVRAELTATDRLLYSIDKANGDQAFRQIIVREIENLQKLLETFKSKEFTKLISEIIDAKRVIVVGFRASAALAQYFGYFLAKIHPDVLTITDGGSVVYDRFLQQNGVECVVVILAFPRYPKETVELMHFLKSEKFRVVAITDSPLSPVAQLAHLTLLAPVDLITLFDCYAAPMVLLNVIINEVGKKNKEVVGRFLERFEGMARENKIFFSGG